MHARVHLETLMETVKRRVFRPAPHLEKDVDQYMDYKLHKYIKYLDSIDEGLYCIDYETDIPTKEELLNGVDQSNCVGGGGSYRLRKRIRWEKANRIAEQLEEERLADQFKQEEYEKTDEYKLKQIMREKATAQESRTKQEKAAAEEDKLYWEKYDNQEVKASSNITFEPELPYIAPTEPVNERRNEGMSVKLLSSALKEIAEDQEVQLLKELDEKYMGLECLPLKSFIKETRAHEIREDAKVNSLKLAKLLKEEGGSMAADQYTHSLELLYQYINRVEYIDKLRGDTYGDC